MQILIKIDVIGHRETPGYDVADVKRQGVFRTVERSWEEVSPVIKRYSQKVHAITVKACRQMMGTGCMMHTGKIKKVHNSELKVITHVALVQK